MTLSSAIKVCYVEQAACVNNRVSGWQTELHWPSTGQLH